ncbi:MAG: IS256 family transposase [Actinomycetia bacterium]|nr:IS256 family transposase [Actinomycetes bacterium]
MQQNTTFDDSLPSDSSGREVDSSSYEPRDMLTGILRRGAQQMLAAAIENEVAEYLAAYHHELDEHGHRLVVRNGHMAARSIQTGLGPVEVARPRVNDKRRDAEGNRMLFTSKILPPYLRRTKAIDELVPWLYLKGVSTGDFPDALQALLGPGADGLSATNICRLKRVWEDEWKDWSHRDLADKQYAYVWADGIYFNIRLADEANKKQCILVLMGATANGRKELIGITDGYRESEQSWLELLRDLQARGLTVDPKLAVADGALGFWAAARKVWPATREQRCWVHKTANVLNKLPKSVQPKAKAMLHEIWQAETKANANKAFDLFVATFAAKYPKAIECLRKDRDVLLTFYDFPAEHWIHLRTTNPIESTFATVRLRHRRTKGSGSRAACLAMVFKLAQAAEKRWRQLNGSALLPDVIRGVRFVDGIKAIAA